jgi:hypothetical protein
MGDYSVAELRTGIEALKTVDWPPMLPEVPQALPATDRRRCGLRRGRARVPQAVHRRHGQLVARRDFLGCQTIGFCDLTTKPYDHLRFRWRAALDNAKRESDPVHLPALPARGEVRADPERVRANLRRPGCPAGRKTRIRPGGVESQSDRQAAARRNTWPPWPTSSAAKPSAWPTWTSRHDMQVLHHPAGQGIGDAGQPDGLVRLPCATILTAMGITDAGPVTSIQQAEAIANGARKRRATAAQAAESGRSSPRQA